MPETQPPPPPPHDPRTALRIAVAAIRKAQHAAGIRPGQLPRPRPPPAPPAGVDTLTR